MPSRFYDSTTVGLLPQHLRRDMADYLDVFLYTVAVRLHAMLTRLTPVDTGYLRLSLSARIVGEAGFLPAAKIYDAKNHYRQEWGQSVASSMAAIGRFAEARGGKILQIGYTADYATYVEDHTHMVKTVQNAVPSVVRQAVNEIRQGVAQAKAQAEAEARTAAATVEG